MLANVTERITQNLCSHLYFLIPKYLNRKTCAQLFLRSIHSTYIISAARHVARKAVENCTQAAVNVIVTESVIIESGVKQI
jgi:hypothetical protein